MVFDQYAQRFLDHQKRNYEQHMAALPRQHAKRLRDKLRDAREAPVLAAYRIFPVFSPAQLLRLRDFANDHLLRGCVLYVRRCDAVVLLSGGRHAVRDLHRWITAKMRWEHPDTRATLLCHVPLPDALCFSFHRRAARARQDGADGGAKASKTEAERQHAESFQRAGRHKAPAGEEGEEDSQPVFMAMEDTVRDGFAFLAELPVSDRALWPDLTSVWRAAFLATGTSP
ncbi:hypothetical protein STCU_09109 [Strigomonas culicis]|uniref:Small nuclear ribonucleoprotein Prp3 C-terminal domain-containing protein n=1 Tax=Strigomonas culicis TaxID=28005 RepID=S9TUH6_9TRYP|nr:hypothetical protein STCU_09109 [Strigomonas culicis]|eukprot:EPY20209.1 hypothetical protein STCU_09109 [Strigomonas culicis]